MKFYLIILITIAYLLHFIHAFCVYNNSPDNSFYIRQMPLNTGGGYYSRFKREKLEPGQSACCHYTSHDCNNNGNPDNIVILAFQPNCEGNEREMFTVTLSASGWVNLDAKGLGDPQVEVFNADGSPMKYELQRSPRAILLNRK